MDPDTVFTWVTEKSFDFRVKFWKNINEFDKTRSTQPLFFGLGNLQSNFIFDADKKKAFIIFLIN